MAAVSARSDKLSRDDFALTSLLGEGSYARVFLATHKKTGKKYAAKVVNIKQIQRLGKSDSVMKERKCLAMCSHPNIVKLHYSFKDNQSLYFMLEFVSGGELLDLITNLKKLPNDVAQFFTAEVLIAVGYIHGKGILHRDIKPENILVTESRHIKLTDFGTSGFFNPNSQKEKKNETGRTSRSSRSSRSSSGPRLSVNRNFTRKASERKSCVGTAEYVAPEVLEGKTGQTGACDVWSVGCLLYHMVVGKPPFKGASDWLTMQEVKKADPDYPQELSESTIDLIRKILVTEPSSRLGAADINEIRSHKFFEGIEWNKIHSKEPPTWDESREVDQDLSTPKASDAAEFRSNLFMSRVTVGTPDGIRFIPDEDNDNNDGDNTTPAGIRFIQEEDDQEMQQRNPKPKYKAPSEDFTDNIKRESLSLDISDSTNASVNESLSKIMMDHKDLKRFLYDGEEIVFAGLIVKRSFSGMSIIPRKRQLILTKMTNSLLWAKCPPRILYVDPKQAILKGQIPWDADLYAEVKSRKTFTITAQKRLYTLKCLSHEAAMWVETIERVRFEYEKRIRQMTAESSRPSNVESLSSLAERPMSRSIGSLQKQVAKKDLHE